LLCAAGRTPTALAAFLFCSRSSIYRIVRAYRAETLVFLRNAEAQLMPLAPLSGVSVTLQQALVTMLTTVPQAYS
jgi:hypothetical protein